MFVSEVSLWGATFVANVLAGIVTLLCTTREQKQSN